MKMRLVAVLLAIVVTMAPLAQGLPDDESPAAVERWFQKLPYGRQTLTKLHFYLNNIVSVKPPNSAPVAQANTTANTPDTSFGLVNVLDGPLTLTTGPGSRVIGYAQGLFTFCSQEERSTLMTLNFVFTEGSFKGSTLSIMGRNLVPNKYREFSVVGGSGDFRLANGIGTASTYYVDAAKGDDILEIHLVFFRYVLPYYGEDSTDE